ncbi:MAG: hypothetical protein LJE65_00945 [Desulfobacteraceae bacterium]|jgi:predicted Rossmann fold nucleotide-binding protein DprA/Smf involved in DNA uptake|nr:hypothetical protein [Desulfobacteraceae bacterium]
MANLQAQLKVVAQSLKKLTKDIEKASKEAAKLSKPKKSAPKAKAAAKKSSAKKSSAKKSPKKKAAPRKKSSDQDGSVLEAVYVAVKRSRKGASITQLKDKTGLKPRQLSNALYKLSKRGDIEAVSRGVYKKK